MTVSIIVAVFAQTATHFECSIMSSKLRLWNGKGAFTEIGFAPVRIPPIRAGCRRQCNGEDPAYDAFCFWRCRTISRSRGAKWAMMGEGCSGCHAFIASRSGIDHSSGEWTIVPGFSALSSTSNACRITRICPATSPGLPSVCPKGYSTAKVRGAPTRSAQKGIIVTRTVARPVLSRVRANTGTLMVQSGQAGVSRTQFTPSAFIFMATSGPYFRSQPVVFGGVP
jgi:hypothetical protein